MNVIIKIHFIASDSKVLQSGSFPLKGKRAEVVAFNWWKKIQRELPVDCELEKVICDGDNITDLVKKLEKPLSLVRVRRAFYCYFTPSFWPM